LVCEYFTHFPAEVSSANQRRNAIHHLHSRPSEEGFANFNPIFIHHFERTLGYVNATSAQIAQARLLLGGFSYHKTHNRSVLGTLNDMKYAIESMLTDRLGRLPETDKEHRWVASFLNETPCRGKDLKGVVFPDREILAMIDRAG
jgi:hypothetical protein